MYDGWMDGWMTEHRRCLLLNQNLTDETKQMRDARHERAVCVACVVMRNERTPARQTPDRVRPHARDVESNVEHRSTTFAF